MAKIFDVNTDVHESPNRNTFDLTHKRHMTGKAGVIYPFFCQPVVPTDSFEIDTAIGANLMPMWYPTQSNMRFIVHYFFVPNRIMQKGWKNQLEGLENENFPYMDVPISYWKTSSLADYLGVPTNVVTTDNQVIASYTCPINWVNDNTPAIFTCKMSRPSEIPEYNPTVNNFLKVIYEIYKGTWDESLWYPEGFNSLGVQDLYLPYGDTVNFNEAVGVISQSPLTPVKGNVLNYTFSFPGFSEGSDVRGTRTAQLLCVFDAKNIVNFNEDMSSFLSNISFDKIKFMQYMGVGDYSSQGYYRQTIYDVVSYNAAIGDCDDPRALLLVLPIDFESGTYAPSGVFPAINNTYVFTYNSPAGVSIEVSDFRQFCPYYNSQNTQDTVKISAFPFRAYDMIYNAYYRNSQGVQPFVVNGQTKYNEYLRTDADGADANQYELKSRNWELDAYTSCLPSPQQGDAPIISVDTLGRMRIMDEDGTTSTLELRDLQGEQGIEVKNVDIQNPEHARLAMRMATSGLTIADFRQGNALQRFLEQSLRSGYRYADFIFGHFGSAPKHQELDMPIFLGGYTQNIDVSKISNVSSSGNAPLGEFAGVGASFGGAKHNIKHYFDDYGWVIGVMMLVPDPAYSQILPKPFTYSSRLDWYFPEFSQLGLQPVTYEEVCPIQSHVEHLSNGSKLLTDTFGYQRPNHEYVWLPDTLHGLFRKELNGSVVNRRFGSRPVLGDNFLKIKPEEVNDIFSLTEKNDDIFIAQVVVDIKATRPIPRVVVPSLGR